MELITETVRFYQWIAMHALLPLLFSFSRFYYVDVLSVIDFNDAPPLRNSQKGPRGIVSK